ncbi:MAG: hypothetical protein ACQERD_10445 [Campylobacterota bacterium]
MSSYNNINSQRKDLSKQIVELVRHKQDYQGAAKIMIDNSMTLNELSSLTYKLRELDFAILADKILLSK